MRVVRTIVFLCGWMVWTVALGLLALPTMVSRRAVWWAAGIWVYGSLWWLRVACGITSQVQGTEHLRDARIIASRHQSAWDTLILWHTLKNPMFVLKRELYWIPVFGWYLWRTGQIGIDRANPKGAIARIVAALGAPEHRGRTLVIFPEGTRTPPGMHRSFRPGIGKISSTTQLAVVPAALNAGLFWPKRPWIKREGTAIIRFLSPVAAPDETKISEWVQAIQKSIESVSQELQATSHAAKK